MKPVDQQYLLGNPDGYFGDCFRACIATLLDLPAEQVPHFIQQADENRHHWMHTVNEWLKERQLCYVRLDATSNSPFYVKYAGYHIIDGVSPRSTPEKRTLHSVVGHSGEMVHDPHPSREGVTEVTAYGFLMPLDPAAEKVKP